MYSKQTNVARRRAQELDAPGNGSVEICMYERKGGGSGYCMGGVKRCVED